jgi:TfoX/Sxy family transcriptional regulator of competence genes
MDFLLDVLSDSRQVTARRMFGEYCLYYAGRPVGLVCDEQLFLKPTDAGKRLMKSAAEGAPFPGARPHLLISADDWDDRAWLNTLVRTTFESLPPPKRPKLPKAKVPKTNTPHKAVAKAGASKPAAQTPSRNRKPASDNG